MNKTTDDKWIPAHWTFENKAVAERFNRHVREQLPWYDHLMNCIVLTGAHYIPRNGLVYDDGASTGNVGRALAPYLLDRKATLVSIEPAKEMSANAKKAGLPPGRWVAEDALKFKFEQFDFAVLNLVLMFMPVGKRAAFLRKLKSLLRPGGAIVVVDKVVAPAGYLGTVLRRMAIKWKLEAGAKPEEIVEKELSLGGVQRPIGEFVIPSGATEFFRFGEFAGWIIEQSEDESLSFNS